MNINGQEGDFSININIWPYYHYAFSLPAEQIIWQAGSMRGFERWLKS